MLLKDRGIQKRILKTTQTAMRIFLDVGMVLGMMEVAIRTCVLLCDFGFF